MRWRAAGTDVVFLFDGDGRRDAFDGIGVRLVHAVEKLPDVRREGFDVAALALGIKRVEGQRGLAGAGRAGDDGEFAKGNLEIEIAEVVLAAAVKADAGGWAGIRRHAGELIREWLARQCKNGRVECRNQGSVLQHQIREIFLILAREVDFPLQELDRAGVILVLQHQIREIFLILAREVDFPLQELDRAGVILFP